LEIFVFILVSSEIVGCNVVCISISWISKIEIASLVFLSRPERLIVDSCFRVVILIAEFGLGIGDSGVVSELEMSFLGLKGVLCAFIVRDEVAALLEKTLALNCNVSHFCCFILI
jgi:hypothetical protein